MNNDSIKKFSPIIIENLSKENFFKDFLVECNKKKLIEDSTLERIAYERLEILKTQLTYYTKNESSSVMIEDAESILASIDYSIGIYLKGLGETDNIINELKNNKLSRMFENGQDLIKKMTAEGRALLKHIKQESRLKVDNYSYNDTVDKGLDLFFKQYESFFNAHETPGSIDYQLCIDYMNYVGIEYIYNYLQTLELENEFCSKFDIDDINKLLNGYDERSELLLINIFELVFTNALGLTICNRNPRSLNIREYDRTYIKSKLVNEKDLEDILRMYCERCLQSLSINDEKMINYVENALSKIAHSIKTAIAIDKLENVFISFREDNEKNIIRYSDGKPLSNSAFKKLTEKIRECSLLDEKLALINENIKSLKDLIDMLGAECLFNDEYNMYFKTLSEFETALLLLEKDNVGDREWKERFAEFISNMADDELSIIEDIKACIVFM